MRRAVVWLPMLVCACGGASPPREDPALAFLQVGVDPYEEARAVEESLSRAGWELCEWIEGRTFVALAMVQPDRGERAVRIVTRRGIAMTMDVPGDQSAQPVGLLDPAEGEGGQDLDGDGREEVVLWRWDPVRRRRCLAVARVVAEGYVVPVPAELEGLGGQACIESLRDVGGDGRPEALVTWRLDEHARASVPAVQVPLAWRDDGFVPAPRGMDAWWDAERTRREEELARARAARDVETSYTLAVELAAIARARGEPVRAQVLAFDEALRGLVLTEAQAEALRETRDRIAGVASSP